MKKHIINAIICTLILFVWQAISWMALPTHNDAMKYTPQQGEILASLTKNLNANGVYAVPGTDPSQEMSFETMEAQSKAQLGKPWALIFYNTSFEGMNASNMICGVLLNLVAAIIMLMVLHGAGAQNKKPGTVFGLVMLLPIFTIFQSILENANWFAFPWHFIKGTMFDLVIGWALCGAFITARFKKAAKQHSVT